MVKGLRSFAEYDPEVHRELSSRGGIASGKARRERKHLRDELSALLSSDDAQKRICTALIRRAMEGDARAFSIIRDTLGEKPAMEIDLGNRVDTLEEFRRAHADEIAQFVWDDFVSGESKYGMLARDLMSLEEKTKMFAERLNREASAQNLIGVTSSESLND